MTKYFLLFGFNAGMTNAFLGSFIVLKCGVTLPWQKAPSIKKSGSSPSSLVINHTCEILSFTSLKSVHSSFCLTSMLGLSTVPSCQQQTIKRPFSKSYWTTKDWFNSMINIKWIESKWIGQNWKKADATLFCQKIFSKVLLIEKH